MQYDIYYLERMCKVIGSIMDFQNYQHSKITLKKYELWDKIHNIISASMGEGSSSFCGTYIRKDLSENEITSIKKCFKAPLSEIILKPVESPCSYTEFLKLYKHLKKDLNRNIINNLVKSNLDSDIKPGIYCAKNIKLTIDAFNISPAELDQKIEKGKYIVTKLLNKGSRDVGGRTIDVIAEKINQIIEDKYSKQDGDILCNGYWDDSLFGTIINEYWDDSLLGSIITSNNERLKPTYNYYKQFPITPNDLYKGRIIYKKEHKELEDKDEKNKYFEYDYDFLAQEFKDLKKLERKMILNTIYELIYSEYQQQLNLQYARFKKTAPSINNEYRLHNKVLTPKEYELAVLGNQILERLSKGNKDIDEND